MMHPLRVLVVDDERSVREGTKLLLHDVGHEAEPVADAEAALRRLDEAPWDVVVTDLCMPGMDGLALLDEIKRRCPTTDVILVTATGSEETRRAALSAGAVQCLLKPFDFCDLEACLDRLCARHPPRA